VRVLSTFAQLPKSALGHKLSLNTLMRVSAFCRSRPDPSLSLLTAQPDSRVVRTSSALPFLSQRWSLGVVKSPMAVARRLPIFSDARRSG
jgi:hypothetical protein